MPMNLPIMLTWLRILFIPLMMVFFYLDAWWAPFMTAFTFGIAGLTDWADGYFARKMNLESRFGAFLDPVADKLIVVVALLLIVEREGAFWFTLASIIIIGREIIISALREWMAQIGATGSMAVSYIAKVKTTAQIIALIFLLYNQNLFVILPIREMGIIALVIATGLTVMSMLQYLQGAFKAVQALKD